MAGERNLARCPGCARGLMNVGNRASLLPDNPLENDPVVLGESPPLNQDGSVIRPNVAVVICPYSDCQALLAFLPL